MSSLSLRSIFKSFGSTKVISDVSLDVGSGDFFSLLGPSGCGKSTLLRIIAGLESADSGSVSVDGMTVDAIPPHKRGIGMVFQQYALWPHMTIAQNVRFGLETQALNNKERDDRTINSLNRVQMSEYRHRYPHQISGGQQQRVALARALAMQPSIILLDEPLSNLDARLRAEIRQELAELHRHLNTTMVYVTHDQEDALSLSTHIAIMNRGAIEQIGTPQEIYRDPASPFCARFIGDANLVPCSITEQISAEIVRVALDDNTPLRFEARLQRSAKSEIKRGFLCLRPSTLALNVIGSQVPPSHNAVKARVVHSTYKGAEYEVELVTENSLELKVACRDFQATPRLVPNFDVLVSWPANEGVFVPDAGD